MRTIGVVSDTHGNIDAVKACADLGKDVDEWYHLGDLASDADVLGTLTNKPVHFVCGNCDIIKKTPQELVIDIESSKILMLHGHKYYVEPDRFYPAFLRAEELGCNVLLFGHTHVPELSMMNGILVLNPGSPSRPRLNKRPSFALLRIDGAKVNAEIIPIKNE